MVQSPLRNRIIFAAILIAEIVVLGLVAFTGRGASAEGLIVRPGAVTLDAQEQTGPWGTVVVQKVVALSPSWIVVQAREGAGTPTDILGYVHVPAGTSNDVAVTLDPGQADINSIVVSMVSDRGKPDVLEYTVARSGGGGGMGGGGMGGAGPAKSAGLVSAPATASIDKPLVAGGKPVAVVLNEASRDGFPGIVHRIVALR